MASLVALGVTGLSTGSAAVRQAATVDVFSTWYEGPYLLYAPSQKDVWTLRGVDKGTYVLWAKAYLRAQQPGQHVTCNLVAGRNDDESKVDLGKLAYGNDTIALHVVHTFAREGSATLRCNANVGTVYMTSVRVSAVRVASATTTRAAASREPASAGTGRTLTQAFATYRDGPVEFSGSKETVLASLALGAGNYVLWAKAYVQPTKYRDDTVYCRLSPFRKFGESWFYDESAVTFAGRHPDTLVDHLVIPLTHPDTVYLVCHHVSGGVSKASFIKLTAVRAGAIEDNGHAYAAPQTTSQSAPAAAYSAYHDEPVSVAKSTLSPVVKLWIPRAGSYLVWAKAYAKSTVADRPTTCMLKAGGADDESKVWLDAQGNHSDTLFTHVVSTFKKANPVSFSCKAAPPSTAPVKVYWAKVTAVRIASFTNTPSSG